MPGHALLAVEAAQATLRAALEALAQRDVHTSREAPTKREVLQAAERVKSDAAKVGVRCSEASGGAAALPPDVTESLVGALQQSCLAFCAACYALSGAAAGATLRKDVRKLAAGVVEPSIDLLKALEAGGDLKRTIGHVWAGCDAVGKAALDNKGAIFKALAGVMAVLKDTLREMEELEQEGGSGSGAESDGEEGSKEGSSATASAASGGASAAAGAAPQAPAAAAAQAAAGVPLALPMAQRQAAAPNNLREIADLDFEAGKLSSTERELLGSCQALMQAGTEVIKVYGRALLQGPALAADGSGPGGSEALDGWESALFHARNLQRCVEDLGAAMYPPMDLEEVASAADGVATTAEVSWTSAPAPDAVGAALPRLTQLLAATQERVEKTVAAAEAAASAAEGDAEGS